ncbi:ABC transporter transmembrane region [Opisthorchis viverrini]|uniref:ABC transporter transmembrane region n=1 Tax=Opisthorchis viverrini TaxID=6198 RepID=A0A1S8X0X7_OPIVI|nr:ABC transporter transmembrane region [Opisthorchis viverrini]
MVCFGILLSIVVGILVTMNVALFRNILNVLTVPPVSFSRARNTVVFFAVLGLIILVTSFIHAFLLKYAAKQQLNRIRLLYFKALMRQEVSWIDRHPIGSLLVKLSHDTYLIEQGIGTKLGEFVQNVSSFISGIIFCFAFGWKLTLAACATLPFMAAAFTLFGVFTRYFAVKQLKAYARAGSIAHEALTAIRTVLAFGGEQKELHRYSEELESAKLVGIKRNAALGGITGAIGLTIYTSTGIILWYGVQLMLQENYDHGTIILIFMNIIMGSMYLGNALPFLQHFTNAKNAARDIFGTIERIFMNIIMGSMYLGNALPFLQHFTNAKNAARDIFGTIERKPQIGKGRDKPMLAEFKGDIQFQNVSFAYPSRPDVPVSCTYKKNIFVMTTNRQN